MYAPFHTTSSMPMHPVMETPALSTASVFPMDLTWSTSRMQQACPSPSDNSIVVTPPSEGPNGFPPPPYPYPTWSNYDSPQNMPIVSATLHSDCYFDGSSLENIPLSSPGSSDSAAALHEVDEMLYSQSPPSMAMPTSLLCDSYYTQGSIVPTTQYEAPTSIYSAAASPIIVPTSRYEAPARVYGSSMSGRVERTQEPAEHVQKEIKMPQSKHATITLSMISTHNLALSMLVFSIIINSKEYPILQVIYHFLVFIFQEKEAFSCGSFCILS